MTQLDIFEQPVIRRGLSIATPPRARNSDPHTSTSAAKSMAKGARAHQDAILHALATSGAQTAHELAIALFPLDSVQITRRLSELNEDGKITRRQMAVTADGKPIYQTRLSPSGRPACVWHLNL